MPPAASGVSRQDIDELDEFLQEAAVTAAEFVAVLTHFRYRKDLLDGLKAAVREFKRRHHSPSPIIPSTDYGEASPEVESPSNSNAELMKDSASLGQDAPHDDLGPVKESPHPDQGPRSGLSPLAQPYTPPTGPTIQQDPSPSGSPTGLRTQSSVVHSFFAAIQNDAQPAERIPQWLRSLKAHLDRVRTPYFQPHQLPPSRFSQPHHTMNALRSSFSPPNEPYLPEASLQGYMHIPQDNLPVHGHQPSFWPQSVFYTPAASRERPNGRLFSQATAANSPPSAPKAMLGRPAVSATHSGRTHSGQAGSKSASLDPRPKQRLAPLVERKPAHEQESSTSTTINGPSSRTDPKAPSQPNSPPNRSPSPDMSCTSTILATDIVRSSLTAPESCIYLDNTPKDGTTMSLVARIAAHDMTRKRERGVELDFGNGQHTTLLVAKDAPAELFRNIHIRFAVGTLVNVTGVTALQVLQRHFLYFGSGSGMSCVEGVTFEEVAGWNADLNRTRKRSKVGETDAEKGRKAFLDERSRRIWERYNLDKS